MTEPQYQWQAPAKRAMPAEDLPEEAFDQRLEELIHHLSTERDHGDTHDTHAAAA